MRVAVVGSQVINRRQAEHAWLLIEAVLGLWKPDEVWSGGATGVDSVAEAVAASLGYRTEDGALRTLVVCKPDVNVWEPAGGKRGFKARNLEIANGVDKLVRISKHEGQRTYGSGWTADQAEERLGSENVFRYYI